MELLFGQVVDGLTLGSVYALIALGYTLVYGILKLLNFAHGDVYMVGAFIGFGRPDCARRAGHPAVPVWLLLTAHVRRAMAGCGCSASRSSVSPTGRCATRRGSRR